MLPRTLFTLTAALSTLAIPRLLPADDTQTGTIAGVVTFRGEVPKKRVPDNLGRRRPLLHVDEKSHGLQHAVAYLAGDLPETDAEPAKKPVVVDQKGETFVPHLMAITAGRKVKFVNNDNSIHNVHAVALDPKNQFNVYTAVGGGYTHAFVADAKNRPVRISCDVHAWMSAWVYVFEHPFHAVTDAKGRFRIAGVPPGEYTLVVRQPDGGLHSRSKVTVSAGEKTTARFGFDEEQLQAVD